MPVWEQVGTLCASGYPDKLTHQDIVGGVYPVLRRRTDMSYVVRRLTPEECELLQGFPKGWTDLGDWTDSKGKVHKAADSPRYKALGNSIAVGYVNERRGYWCWLLERISAMYERTATLGSLFDGIGGFPLAWEAVNGKGSARWASEIEEFPIAVTKKWFPEMKHLGDITKLNGAEMEPVDCITGGSPCQDLSVAGKRAGLDGERSGLFMEQIRIIKEMREHDRSTGRTGIDIRPRTMVWENVVGALSSGDPKGEDFRIVLEETARIADPTAVIPGPPKGKWANEGVILGNGYSLAWRVHDAQYWGVAQRRRRISLVADFGGDRAAEISFERTSVQRHPDEG